MGKKMDATISSKKPKRTPKNAARSAHGQRIQNASCEPPTPIPTLSSSNLNVRTRSAARREAAIMAAIPIRSVPRAPSASPQDSANNKEINKKKSVRFALDDGVVADVNTTTTTKDKPTPSDSPIKPATAPASSSTTLTTQRPRPLSAPHILDQLLSRNPDFGAVHARLRLPSAAPRLLLRPLFADARSGKFSESTSAAKSSPKEEEGEDEQETGEKEKQEKQENKKKMDKKAKAKLLRKMVARIVHDTRDGRDELTNAGYFLQVLEEVEARRTRGSDAGAGDEGLVEGGGGVMPWLVEEVFKMLVILVSWHRQLAPREEGEDAGCVLSMRQVLGLVEGEIEAATRIVQGAA